VLQPGGFIALEIGYNQAETVRRLARDTFPTATVRLHQAVEERDRLIWIQTHPHAD
jgi:methylase of polypeptide subunit release factors